MSLEKAHGSIGLQKFKLLLCTSDRYIESFYGLQLFCKHSCLVFGTKEYTSLFHRVLSISPPPCCTLRLFTKILNHFPLFNYTIRC